MGSNLLLKCCFFASALPLLAMVAILLHYLERRAAWNRKRRRGQKNLGFCPSAAAFGAALLFMQIFIRPSLQHVIEERQQEDEDEEDSGDPDSGEKHFHRQLKRIRRGEKIDRLVWRL